MPKSKKVWVVLANDPYDTGGSWIEAVYHKKKPAKKFALALHADHPYLRVQAIKHKVNK